MRSLLACLIVVALLLPTAPPAQAAQPPNGLVIFGLIGQSNMYGTVPVTVAAPTDDRIWMYDGPRGWRLANDPLHGWLVNYQGEGSIGPGMSIARTLVQRDPSLRVGIVPCAHPGRVRDWQKDAPPTVGETESNYARCLRWLQEARATSGGAIGGILTYQGEADTTRAPGGDGYQPSAGAEWRRYYEQMIADFRADLGLTMPAIHAQIATVGCGAGYPDWDLVKGVQAGVSLPKTTWIRTDDIPLDYANDCIHHTLAGYQEVGRRFAEAWLTLRAPVVTCTQNRPALRIERQIIAPGRMRVTVRAGVGVIYGVSFNAGQNVQPVTDLVISQSEATFTLARAGPGPTHLPFTVTDACGQWRSFVGGGAGSF